MANKIIKPGDKIDIRLLQQLERSETSGDKIHIYKSQVYDVYNDGELEISMPTENGKMILLPLGIRFEFGFYSNGGFYRAEGTIKERFKKNNLYSVVIELKSQLEKFQRREYYRLECTLDLRYYHITEEEMEERTPEEIFDYLRMEKNMREIEGNGTIVDISGGGIRFTSDKENFSEDNILINMKLEGEKVEKQFFIVGKIIECNKIQTEKHTKYESRVKFLMNDNKVREEIIHYIFDEERRKRSLSQ